MAQTAVKTNVTAHTTELTQSVPANVTKATIINRFNRVMQYHWRQGVVATGGDVIQPYAVKTVNVPLGATLIYFLSFNLGDVFEVQYTT
jgi:hypothetical protein